MSDTTAGIVVADLDTTNPLTAAVAAKSLKTNDTGILRVVKDCASGTFGGIVQVFIGQPFDTVKVRLQTQLIPSPGQKPRYSSLLDCVKKTRQQEGFTAFYKGTTTPLVGIGACVSIQFVILEHMKRVFNERNANKVVKENVGLSFIPLNNLQLYCAGALAGTANSFVSGPVEHIRTRLQVQTKSAPTTISKSLAHDALPFFRGPIDCFRYLYKSRGIRGIYKGQGITIIREFQGYGVYFLVYEYLTQRAMLREGKMRNELEGWKSCLFGAAAGYGMWISIYPIDVIKSKIQTDFLSPETRHYKSSLDCAQKIFATEGLAGFFRGFGACMWRAGPVNAGTFVAFEFAMRVLDKL
ncbi:10741_t:CDS:2 [Ambispora gerdemannii]|uniref:10741_t:CDS:1 n=1 Tax=Ambispora gerdemannii TaxID=144530 RepID=A0A9N9DZ68_9GLOM|nr:10741_t:CDS:2 [Ambispora gerdemannii]